MTAVQIATEMIDKLQEENQTYLNTLYKAQDIIKHSERELADKDMLIKVLEDRLRIGTDGILEMTNRQKALTIKHLELQIQRLLKENEDIQLKIDGIMADLCAKCETQLILKENYGTKSISKSYKATGAKKTSPIVSPSRIRLLERIIEHKDQRITHLSKEVQRLTKTEKELTQKIYRLTKLLPMSRQSSEVLIDSLLREIQLLESHKGIDDKYQLMDYINYKTSIM